MTTTTKQLNFSIISMSLVLLVYLGGTAYALVTQLIGFAEFVAAVGVPLGGMGGWNAKAATIPTSEKLLS